MLRTETLALVLLIWNVGLSITLLLMWLGALMNPYYLFCMEANTYGEFWIEVALIVGTPIVMVYLYVRREGVKT